MEKIHFESDWSPLSDPTIEAFRSRHLDPSLAIPGFGLHTFEGTYRTGAFIGARWIPARHGSNENSEEAIVIAPRFNLEPMQLLNEISEDPEFGMYFEVSVSQEQPLFEVYPEQPLIKVPAGTSKFFNALLVLGFIHSCYSVCRTGLIKTLDRRAVNLTGRIRGRLNVSENLRRNVARGRLDRFFCEYSEFHVDNEVNQVLKATLGACKKAIGESGLLSSEVEAKVAFCNRKLSDVSMPQDSKLSPSAQKINGFYHYYRPALRLAEAIRHCGFEPDVQEVGVGESLTVPFSVNMQLLFELYCRKKLKDALPKGLVMDPYEKKIPIRLTGSSSRLHLLNNLKPDIVVRRLGETQNPVAVFDAKYKNSEHPNRSDTHQLLAYAFSQAPELCGFVFPGSMKPLDGGVKMADLATGFRREGGMAYKEFFVNDRTDWSDLIPGGSGVGSFNE